jgi:hypothetical protein
MDNATIHDNNCANINKEENTTANTNINKEDNTATDSITKIEKKNITTIIAEHAGHYDDHEYLNLFDLYDIMG